MSEGSVYMGRKRIAKDLKESADRVEEMADTLRSDFQSVRADWKRSSGIRRRTERNVYQTLIAAKRAVQAMRQAVEDIEGKKRTPASVRQSAALNSIDTP